jgi:predicted transcriptional regulator
MKNARQTESGEINQSPETDASGNIHELARTSGSRQIGISDDQTSPNSLGILLRRVSASSTRQIENLVGELQTLGKKLHTDGDRIQRDIEEYAELNQQVIQLTAIIFDSVKKLPEVRKS